MANVTQNPASSSQNGNEASWSGVANILSSNNTYASIDFANESSTLSNRLRATDFGFSVSSNITIDGIEVAVEAKTNTTGQLPVQNARIIKNGSVSATNEINDNGDEVIQGDTDDDEVFGSSTYLWGETWTSSDINSSNFGFEIDVETRYGDDEIYVDVIEITVYYSNIPSLNNITSIKGATNINL